MKANSYLISIPEPCHEDWNAMQPDARGRFCGVCNKSVLDFSDKTDAEIHSLLSAHKEEKICGHFKKTQVNRPLRISVRLSQLPKSISAAKAFAIAVFLTFGTLLFSCTNYEGKKIGEIKVLRGQEENTYTTGAPIQVLKGEVSMEDPADSTDRLPEGIMMGKLETVKEDSLLSDTLPVMCNTETFIMGDMKVTTIGINDTSSALRPDSSSMAPPAAVKDLLVYPNPGNGEFTIAYQNLKPADVQIDIFDMNGAWLKKVLSISGQHDGNYRIPVSLDSLPNGIYLVNMIRNGERFTQKLVIEK